MRCFVCALFIVAFFLGGLLFLASDCVDEEFGAIMNRYHCEDHMLISKKRNWYKAFRVNEQQMWNVLSDNLGDLDFKGWKRFQKRIMIGTGQLCHLDGISRNIMYNATLDSNEFDMVCIFLDIDYKVLIFYYGRT